MAKQQKKKGMSFDDFKAQYNSSPSRLEGTKNTNSSASVQNDRLPEVFLPADTSSVINRDQIQNFAIKFQKFARFDKDKFSFYKTDKGNIIFTYAEGYPFNGLDFNSLCSEQKKCAEILFPDNHAAINLQIDWRLAIGLGTESVYETSINLHPVYGFPYIPGQAVKGITRSWVIVEYFGEDEKKAFQNKVFCHLFGCPKESLLKEEHQGSLVFFDAYPTAKPKLKVDIMNPHYGPYYSEGKPPADYYNPTPIPFLTVEDTHYQFILGIRESDNMEGEEFGETKAKKSFFELGKKYLKEALTQKGMGAKSAVGYGYFKENA